MVPETEVPEVPLWVRILAVLESAHRHAYALDIGNATVNLAADVRERPLTKELRECYVALAAAMDADLEQTSEPTA